MKFRSKAPPEAIPFQRGKPAAKPASARHLEIDWISPGTWSALEKDGTDAHRIASGSEMWLERFGPDLLLSHQTERGRDTVMEQLDRHCADYSYSPRRIFGKYLPHHASERSAPILLRGNASAPMETEVQEAGVRFGLDFAAGYSAGLFIDQRLNRARMRSLKPKRVLNTFAYTCSFSVVAASVGAETVSVDLSRRSLTRGEDNFKRNGLDPKSGHRFIADDVLGVMPRLARRGDKFDIVILDPPTFSRNQEGEAFQVQKDFDRLVALALEVAAPRANILLSVNHSAMRVADLEWSARGALKMAGRSGRFIPATPLPDFPSGHGAKTLWLEVR